MSEQRRSTKRAVTVVALMSAVVAACGGGDDQPTAATTSPTTAVTTTAPATAPPTAPTTAPPTVPTTAPPTSAATTTLAPTLPQLSPLVAGTTYRLGKAVLGRPLLYTPAVDGSFGFSIGGFFGATLDDLGTEVLFNVTDLPKARVFTDPLVALDSLPDPAAIDAATAVAPADYLAHVAALPGITAGPVEEVELLGFPARSMTYTVGAVTGGAPCFGVDRGPCLLVLSLPPDVVQTYWEGDAGTLYDVTIDGRSVVFDVNDRDGAEASLAGLLIGE